MRLPQYPLTCIAPIRQGRQPDLHAVLRKLAERRAAGERVAIEEIGTIHVARWVLLAPDQVPWLTRPCLLFMSHFDGTWESYLDRFIDQDWEGLDSIFGLCEGYPADGARNRTAFKQYVRDHEIIPLSDLALTRVFPYCAYEDSTVTQVRKALKVRKRLQGPIRDVLTDLL